MKTQNYKTVSITKDIHKRLKGIAKKNQRTMARQVAWWCEEWVKTNAK